MARSAAAEKITGTGKTPKSNDVLASIVNANVDDEQEPIENFRRETTDEINAGDVVSMSAFKDKLDADKNGQPYFDEVAPVGIEELNVAARDYATKRDIRIAAGKEEKTAKDLMNALMNTHKLDEYRCGDISIELKEQEKKWKVSIGAEEDAADDKPSKAVKVNKKANKETTSEDW